MPEVPDNRAEAGHEDEMVINLREVLADCDLNGEGLISEHYFQELEDVAMTTGGDHPFEQRLEFALQYARDYFVLKERSNERISTNASESIRLIEERLNKFHNPLIEGD